VALGDSIIDSRTGSATFLQRLVQLHLDKHSQATIALEKVRPEEVHRYGVIEPGCTEGDVLEILDLVEKPRPTQAPSLYAIAARYVFDPVIFDSIASIAKGVGGEYQLTDAITALCRSKAPVWGLALGDRERRFDIGNFLSYWDAFFQVCIEDPEIGEAFAARARAHLQNVSKDG
jgi:UTP--glucose-1-phosphate uridylyltransferase